MLFKQAGQDRASGFIAIFGVPLVVLADQGFQLASALGKTNAFVIQRVQHAIDIAIVEPGAITICICLFGVDRLSLKLVFE